MTGIQRHSTCHEQEMKRQTRIVGTVRPDVVNIGTAWVGTRISLLYMMVTSRSAINKNVGKSAKRGTEKSKTSNVLVEYC